MLNPVVATPAASSFPAFTRFIEVTVAAFAAAGEHAERDPSLGLLFEACGSTP